MSIGYSDIQRHIKNCDITLEELCQSRSPEAPLTDDEQTTIRRLAEDNLEILEIFGNKSFFLPPDSPFPQEDILKMLQGYKDTFNCILNNPNKLLNR